MREYVKVAAAFDKTGFMQPREIIRDGKVERIEKVKDFRPAGNSDCYTVVIGGENKLLFFQRTDSRFASTFGRWFVEE